MSPPDHISFTVNRVEYEAQAGCCAALSLGGVAGERVNLYHFRSVRAFVQSANALAQKSADVSINLTSLPRGCHRLEILYSAKDNMSHGARYDAGSGRYFLVRQSVLNLDIAEDEDVARFIQTLAIPSLYADALMQLMPPATVDGDGGADSLVDNFEPFVEPDVSETAHVVDDDLSGVDDKPDSSHQTPTLDVEGAVYIGAAKDFDISSLEADRTIVTPEGHLFAIYETAKQQWIPESIVYEQRKDKALADVRRDFTDYETTLPEDFEALPTRDKLKMALKHDANFAQGNGVFRVVPTDVVEVRSDLLKQHAALLLKPVYFAKGLHYQPKVPLLHEEDRYQNTAYQITSSEIFDPKTEKMTASYGHMSPAQKYFCWYLARFGDVPVLSQNNAGDHAQQHLISGRLEAGTSADFELGQDGLFYNKTTGEVIPRVSSFNRSKLPNIVLRFQPSQTSIRSFVEDHEGRHDLSSDDLKALQRPLTLVFSPDFTPAKLQAWREEVASVLSAASDGQAARLDYAFKDETIEHYNNDLFFARTLFPQFGFDRNRAGAFMAESYGPNVREYDRWLLKSIFFDTPNQLTGFLDRPEDDDAKALVSDVFQSAFLWPIACSLTQKDMRLNVFKDLSQLDDERKNRILSEREEMRAYAAQRLDQEQHYNQTLHDGLNAITPHTHLEKKVIRFIGRSADIALQRAALDQDLFNISEEQALERAADLFDDWHDAALMFAGIPRAQLLETFRGLQAQGGGHDALASHFDRWIDTLSSFDDQRFAQISSFLMLKPQDLSYNPSRSLPYGVSFEPVDVSYRRVRSGETSLSQVDASLEGKFLLPLNQRTQFSGGFETVVGGREHTEGGGMRVVVPFDRRVPILDVARQEKLSFGVRRDWSLGHGTLVQWRQRRDFALSVQDASLEHHVIGSYRKNRTFSFGATLPSREERQGQTFLKDYGVRFGVQGARVYSGDGISYQMTAQANRGRIEGTGQHFGEYHLTGSLAYHNKAKAGAEGRFDASVRGDYVMSSQLEDVRRTSLHARAQRIMSDQTTLSVQASVLDMNGFNMNRVGVGLKYQGVEAGVERIGLKVSSIGGPDSHTLYGLHLKTTFPVAHKPLTLRFDAYPYFPQHGVDPEAPLNQRFDFYQFGASARYRF